MPWDGPILDNHLHLDGEDGRGLDAVDEFIAAGGTHLIVINKPSWSYGIDITTAEDFRVGYDATVEMVERTSTRLPGRAWAVLGVHPALISRLVDDEGWSIEDATSIMRAGIDVAAEYVAEGEALGLKTGRPHYPVDDPVWVASNDVIKHTFDRAAELSCAVQLHTEGGEDFTAIANWADVAGMGAERVVKHYANGAIVGPVPSVIARKESLERVIASSTLFLMETDYLDDPSRPGAVLGPKTVPRRVDWLASKGLTQAIEIAHVEAPRKVYGINMHTSPDP